MIIIEDVIEILRKNPPKPGEKGSIRDAKDDTWYDYSRSGQLVHVTCYKNNETIIFKLGDHNEICKWRDRPQE